MRTGCTDGALVQLIINSLIMRQSLIISLFINYATHNSSTINIHFGSREKYFCKFKVKGRLFLLGQAWKFMIWDDKKFPHARLFCLSAEFTRKSHLWRQHNRFICCICSALRPTICSYWETCFCQRRSGVWVAIWGKSIRKHKRPYIM